MKILTLICALLAAIPCRAGTPEGWTPQQVAAVKAKIAESGLTATVPLRRWFQHKAITNHTPYVTNTVSRAAWDKAERAAARWIYDEAGLTKADLLTPGTVETKVGTYYAAAGAADKIRVMLRWPIFVESYESFMSGDWVDESDTTTEVVTGHTPEYAPSRAEDIFGNNNIKGDQIEEVQR